MTYKEIQQMPKVDLHVHLSGCFARSDLWALAQKYHKNITKEEFDTIFSFSNFNDFSYAWKFKNSLIRTYDDFSFLMDGVVNYIKEENYIYWEPAIALFELKPLDTTKLLDIATTKLNASGISYSYIMDLIRGDGVQEINRQYNFYHSLAKDYPIRGVGLAGNEIKHGLSKELILLFAKAKECGYGITVHASEEGNIGNVKVAVNDFRANRIGHANYMNLCCDRQLVDKIENDNIHLEFLPSSLVNWNNKEGSDTDKVIERIPTNMLAEYSVSYPIVSGQVVREIEDYLRADVLNRMFDIEIPSYDFSVSSDDPGMFGVSLSRILDNINCRYDEHILMMRMANSASFASSDIKENVLKLLNKAPQE